MKIGTFDVLFDIFFEDALRAQNMVNSFNFCILTQKLKLIKLIKCSAWVAQLILGVISWYKVLELNIVNRSAGISTLMRVGSLWVTDPLS